MSEPNTNTTASSTNASSDGSQNAASTTPDPNANAGGEGGNETSTSTTATTVPQARVDQIVQERLARERAKWESRFDGIDPDAARAALERVEKLKEDELLDKKQFQELLAAKQQKFETSLAEIQSERDRLSQELRGQTIERTLAEAASRAVKPAHVVGLLRDSVDLDGDGNVVVKSKDGGVLLDEDGVPVQVSAYVDAWLTENDHFLPAAGGRGTGGDGPSDIGGGGGGGDTNDPRVIAQEAQRRYDKARQGRG